MDKKIITAGFVGGLMVVLGGLGITSITKDEGEMIIEPTTEPIQCEQGIQGEVGVRGYTGQDGQDGTDGEDGVDGVKGDTGATGAKGEKGDSVTVEEVLAALEAQEETEEASYSFTGNGEGISNVVTLPVGTYSVNILHIGAGYFGASLNGNGQNTIFVSQDGYVVLDEDIEITEEGDYTVNVTTEGQWTLKIAKQ